MSATSRGWENINQCEAGRATKCQCGFASTIHGNVMTHEEQWAKLRHCVEVADSVWT
jgi:hypothetical protein